MRKISEETRNILAKDKRMRVCALKSYVCQGRLEWHHNLIFGGKQCDWPETIIALCGGFHHRYADQKDIKEKLDYIMLNQMSDKQIQSISKAVDYFQRKKYVTNKYAKNKTITNTA